MPNVAPAQVSYARRYVAQSGDSLYAIARYHGLSTDALLAANPSMRANPSALGVGQAVIIPPTAKAGDTEATGAPHGLTGADYIIDHTARTEGGGRYDAWNKNDVGKGVSFGLIQFNQKAGRLPQLLKAMEARDPRRFRETFGGHTQKLLDEGWVRRANLNAPDLKRRLEASGRDPVFQAVQREMAKRDYFEPVRRLGEQHGLTSQRAMAALFDASVQMGPERIGGMLQRAAAGGGTQKQILQRFARIADGVAHANGRRTQILRDPALSDAPFVDARGAARSLAST